MKSRRTEHDEAVDLVEWAHAHMDSHILVRVPNASTSARNWRRQVSEGASRGFPDYLIIPRDVNVLAWELKKPGEKPTPAQRGWLQRFEDHGHPNGWGTTDVFFRALESGVLCPRSS